MCLGCAQPYTIAISIRCDTATIAMSGAMAMSGAIVISRGHSYE